MGELAIFGIFLALAALATHPFVFIGLLLLIGVCWILSYAGSPSKSGYTTAGTNYQYTNTTIDVAGNRTMLFDNSGIHVIGTAVGNKLFSGNHYLDIQALSHFDGTYENGKVYKGSNSTMFDVPIGTYKNGMLFIGRYESIGQAQAGSYRNGRIYKGTGLSEQHIGTYTGSDEAAAALAILYLF